MVENSVRKIRKFKDKIAMLNNNQVETDAQFDEVMREVSEAKNIRNKQFYVLEEQRTLNRLNSSIKLICC